MSESAPQLSTEDRAQIDQGVKEATEVAKDAWMEGADTYYYNHDTGTRHLGSSFADHEVKQGQRDRLDFHVRDRKDDSRRKAHAYQTANWGSGSEQMTHLTVTRNGETKHMRSDNPLVYKLVAKSALKGVVSESQAEREAHTSRKAA